MTVELNKRIRQLLLEAWDMEATEAEHIASDCAAALQQGGSYRELMSRLMPIFPPSEPETAEDVAHRLIGLNNALRAREEAASKDLSKEAEA
ncbi:MULTISPECIES: ATP/GTP-binding protein [unclassified Thioalkalivibrio]|uniref:ATP/GTP-binding protein n=1 Tax=unclassified Thioalkalivibrio TaxID=2621013 RepID=UPI0012DD72A2|nr:MULTISPECIES: ATP/GTP-binding protein [unclassified Thioalkalivibrio]